MSRTKQIPVALPSSVREWYQQRADAVGLPLASYVRMRLIGLMHDDTNAGTNRAPSPMPVTDGHENDRTLSFDSE